MGYHSQDSRVVRKHSQYPTMCPFHVASGRFSMAILMIHLQDRRGGEGKGPATADAGPIADSKRSHRLSQICYFQVSEWRSGYEIFDVSLTVQRLLRHVMLSPLIWSMFSVNAARSERVWWSSWGLHVQQTIKHWPLFSSPGAFCL